MQANQKISKDKGVRQRNLSGAFFDMPDSQEVCMGRKFDDLSLEEKIAHFDDVAARALPLWGYPEGADKKLLNFMENATYLVKAAGKETMIMRVHRLDYATMNSIRTELCWLTDLKRDTDISLASPIPMENGELVATIETPALNRRYTFHSCNNIAAAMCKVAAYYAVFTPLSTVLSNYLAETAGLPHRGGPKLMFLQFGRFFCIITEV